MSELSEKDLEKKLEEKKALEAYEAKKAGEDSIAAAKANGERVKSIAEDAKKDEASQVKILTEEANKDAKSFEGKLENTFIKYEEKNGSIVPALVVGTTKVRRRDKEGRMASDKKTGRELYDVKRIIWVFSAETSAIYRAVI